MNRVEELVQLEEQAFVILEKTQFKGINDFEAFMNKLSYIDLKILRSFFDISVGDIIDDSVTSVTNDLN